MPKGVLRVTFSDFLARCREKHGDRYEYDVTLYSGMSKMVGVICKIHGLFYQPAYDHLHTGGCNKCGKLQTKVTNTKKYGGPSPMCSPEVKNKWLTNFNDKYGASNPSSLQWIKDKKIETCNKNFGVDHPGQSVVIQDKKKQTNLKKYGFEYPMQNKEISDKTIKTKIETGAFSKSNSSNESAKYIRQYILDNRYSLDQVAYADYDNGLFEWGYNIEGKWMLFDLVVFENGKRGDINSIIEILEFQGPFHYTIDDVNNRGNEKAVPYKTNNMTISESYLLDLQKKIFAEAHAKKFTQYWPNKYHKNI